MSDTMFQDTWSSFLPHTVFVLWLLSIHYLCLTSSISAGPSEVGQPQRGEGGAWEEEEEEKGEEGEVMNGSAGFDVSLLFVFSAPLCVCVCVCAVCACVCVPGRGVILQFPPAAETGDAALGPWWSHSEAFKARHGSYLKQRGFPSALSRFPEIGQSGEISQFRDVLTFCDVFLLCFTERWERID